MFCCLFGKIFILVRTKSSDFSAFLSPLQMVLGKPKKKTVEEDTPLSDSEDIIDLVLNEYHC